MTTIQWVARSVTAQAISEVVANYLVVKGNTEDGTKCKTASLGEDGMDLLHLSLGSTSDEGEDTDVEEHITEPSKKKSKARGTVKLVRQSETSPSFFVRGVPHRRGHWSGHIYVPVRLSDEHTNESLDFFRRQLEEQGLSGTLVKHDHLHLSLSRPFSLQIAFIESFVQKLSDQLEHEPSMNLFLDGRTGQLLVNDEQTRSFWGWKVEPNTALTRLIQTVDTVLEEYNQPPYYKPPKFHVSLASIIGDVNEVVNNSMSLKRGCDHGSWHCLPVNQIVCKFGTTKTFKIDLQSD